MTEHSQICLKCQSPYCYQDRDLWTCPDCFHEWTAEATTVPPEDFDKVEVKFLDAIGTPLQSGDTVSTIKDLKAGKDTIKKGTKAKNIRLLEEPVNGHDIACKIEGHGSLYLKCSVVKKVKN